MKLSQFKLHLDSVNTVNLLQIDGTPIAPHFHITEAGLSTKQFIDCGGTLRTEKVMNFQVWIAQDTDHRLQPDKLKKIIAIAEGHFGTEDLEIEVEYQTETVSRYGLSFENGSFRLLAKHTDCLAKDTCGVPVQKEKVNLADLTPAETCCTPGGGCC